MRKNNKKKFDENIMKLVLVSTILGLIERLITLIIKLLEIVGAK